MDYILGEKPEDCILCRYQNLGEDCENLIVWRGKHCYIMLNRYPYNNGHIMIVPYRHADSLGKLDHLALNSLFRLLQAGESALTEVYKCEGINIGLNLGLAAGAGIRDHLHFHMVPRWQGDSNFMSVISGERVIPEAFELSWQKLRDQFAILLTPTELY